MGQYTYSNGDAAAGSLDYVPMPAEVKTVIRKSWSNIKDGSGKVIAAK